MIHKAAFLDLGTNAFNLLLCDIQSSDNITVVFRDKRFVWLGKHGFVDGKIPADAMLRAVNAVNELSQLARNRGYNIVHANATSAVRDANNREEFVENISRITGVPVDYISGAREAELIYKGVKQSGVLAGKASMVVDIGGGSNEILLCDETECCWKESFNLGVTRLKNDFNIPDPLSDNTIMQLTNHFSTVLLPLELIMKNKNKTHVLIGTSGAFESLRDIVFSSKRNYQDYTAIPLNEFLKLHDNILYSTLTERQRLSGLIPERADTFHLAMVFIHYLVKKFSIEYMFQTDYSLAEGLMVEYAQGI